MKKSLAGLMVIVMLITSLSPLGTTRAQALEPLQVYYPNNADSTVVITYSNLRYNADGSLTSDVTLTNKTAIVYDVIFEHTGDVTAPHNVLNWPLMPLLSKRQWSVPITFQPGSSVTLPAC